MRVFSIKTHLRRSATLTPPFNLDVTGRNRVTVSRVGDCMGAVPVGTSRGRCQVCLDEGNEKVRRPRSQTCSKVQKTFVMPLNATSQSARIILKFTLPYQYLLQVLRFSLITMYFLRFGPDVAL